jgi:hypothetical protein
MRLSSEAIKASLRATLWPLAAARTEHKSWEEEGERGGRRAQGLGAGMGNATVTLSASRQAGARINEVLGRNGQGVHGAPRAGAGEQGSRGRCKASRLGRGRLRGAGIVAKIEGTRTRLCPCADPSSLQRK